MKESYRKYFTLLELLVAMAVFSTMMLVLMQFLGSAQKVSTRTISKVEAYSDARTAIELISRDLKSATFNNMVPLEVGEATGASSVSFTASSSHIGSAIRFKAYSQNSEFPGGLATVIFFHDKSNNELKIAVETDGGVESANGEAQIVISDVSALQFEAVPLGATYEPGDEQRDYYRSSSNSLINHKLPHSVIITLSMGTGESLRSFSKIIVIGERGQIND